MIGSILTILIGIVLITGSIFYLVPISKKQVSGWTTFINKFNKWIHTNWIWCLIIILVIILICIAIYIAIIQKKLK